MVGWAWHTLAWTWGGDGQGGPSGAGYLIMSGPAAALPAYVAFLVWVWSRRCWEAGCWRLWRREDTKHQKVCMKHYRLGLAKPAWDAIAEVREAVERG